MFKKIVAGVVTAAMVCCSGLVFADEVETKFGEDGITVSGSDISEEIPEEISEQASETQETETVEEQAAAEEESAAEEIITEEIVNGESSGDTNNYTDTDADAGEITEYTVHFSMVLDGWPRKDYAVFNIYSEDGELLDSSTRYISETEDFDIVFSVPPAPVGTTYKLEITGIDSVDYYGENYKAPFEEMPTLYTYRIPAGEENAGDIIADASMTLHMRTQCPINIYVDGAYTQLSSPAIFEGSSIIAPLSQIAEAIGITDCTYYPQYNSVKVRTGDNEMLVNIGFSYITVFGSDVGLDVPVSNINSLTYIELRPFVESFGCTLEYSDGGDYIDIRLDKSPMALEATAALEQRINESGLGSSTNYLVWVNKAKFRCTVFEGSSGNWKRLKDFTVGIGAESSETITGVFEYSDTTSMWPYANYYVGPVMIFYGNYALHSTLLKYDGTPYNNNVGVKLSLGCVRCQPQHINWMYSYVPLGSRVYVTEQ